MKSKGAVPAGANVAEKISTESWPAKIIFGEPKSQDEFGGLGHERSGKALADGIRQLAERTEGRRRAGGAIGLEGAWGSGKSTVIDIAGRKYLGTDYRIFTFDLWRHQSDDFRRSLLEQFIGFARGEFNPKGKDGEHIHASDDERPKVDLNVDKIHDDIKNWKSVTTTTSSRRLSLFAAILFILLPVAPLVYGALIRMITVPPATSQATASAQAGTQSSPVDSALPMLANPWVWGALLYFVAAAIGIAAAYRFGFEEKEKFHGKTAWLRGGASRLLNLSERDNNNEVEQRIRDESPTTVEFRSVFEEILVPLQKTGKHIVFVLDNIDRIPAADLSKTWAEMRALIAGNGDIDNRFGAVIAVVPYDRDHVGQAFPSVRVPKLVPNEKDETYTIDRKDGKELETDIFEKTFDRIVKVSAPVPSDWKRFLMMRIEEAGFSGEHEHDHAEKLFRLLQYQLQLEGVHPTPRRIIAYVNEIGGLWAQWAGGTIPIETVGLYVLHRPLFDRDPGILSRQQPVPIRFVRIVDDPEYAKHLAALAFNVEPSLADQVRLGTPITKALLDQESAEGLIALTGADGFYEIFQDELRDRLFEWSKDSPESISLAARHVDELKLPTESEGAIWQIFADAASRIEKLEYGQEDLDGLYTIVRRQKRQSPESVAGLIRAKFEETSLTEDDDDLLSAGTRWYRLMQSLTKAISEAAGVDRARRFWKTRIPSTLGVFNLGVASANQPTSQFRFDELALGCAEADLSQAMLKMMAVNPRGYDFAVGVVWKRLVEQASDHFEAIAAQIVELGEPDEKSIRLLHAAARFMNHGRRASKAMKAAFDVIKNDRLLNYARWAEEKGDDEDLAVSLFLLVTAQDGSPAVAARGSSAPVEWFNNLLQDATELADVPEYMVQHISSTCAASAWIGWAVSSTSETGLYCEVLRAMARSKSIWLSDQPMVAQHYDRIAEIVGENDAAFFLRQFSDYEGRIGKEFHGETLKKVPSGMISALSKLQDDASAKQILEFIREHLAGISADEWYAALTLPSDDNGRLLVAMREHTSLELRSPDFISGLVRVALAVLEGSFDPAPLAKKWGYVLAAIPASQYVPLRAQIVSGMRTISVSASGAVTFVKHFGTVAQKMRFSMDAVTADVALNHFLWHLANSDDDAAARYLEAQAKEVNATLKAASSDEVRNAFLDAQQPKSAGTQRDE